MMDIVVNRPLHGHAHRHPASAYYPPIIPMDDPEGTNVLSILMLPI
jgi:hypothetical protein